MNDFSEPVANPGHESAGAQQSNPSSVDGQQTPSQPPEAPPVEDTSDLPGPQEGAGGAEDGIGQRQAEKAAHDQQRLDREGKWIRHPNDRYKEKIEKNEQERLIEFSSHTVSLKPISEHYLEEARRFFVPPPNYAAFEQRMRSTTTLRMCVISGEACSSKMTTALYLAQQLPFAEAPRFFIFTDKNRTILQIIHDAKLPKNAVILFDKVFDREMMKFDDLMSRLLNLNEELTDAWFIFTVLEGPVLEALQMTDIPVFSTRDIDRQRVIGNLIDFYFPEVLGGETRERLLKVKPHISPSLSFARLRALFRSPPANIDEFLDFLRQEERFSPQAAYAWFNGLATMNQRLYAIMVVLFERLDVSLLEEIYAISINELRRQGMTEANTFIDPRRIGTYEMHVSLGLQVRFNVLEFQNRAYREYVVTQIENFQRLLWSLVDPNESEGGFQGFIGFLRELSNTYMQLARRSGRNPHNDTSQQRSDLEALRSVIAHTIAQVGIYHLNKLELVLRKLAYDESVFVALTAAYILTELAQRGEHLEFVTDILRIWCRSGDFDLMWAATTSVAYIYEAIARMQREEEERPPASMGEALVSGRKRWGSFLAELRGILTELTQHIHEFDEELIEEEANLRRQQYQQALKEILEKNPEAWGIDLPRPFKKLNIAEQEKILAEAEEHIKKTVEEEIEGLVNSWRDRMRMVLMRALWQIAQTRPRDVTRLVYQWLDRKDSESQLWQMGRMALNYLFQLSASLDAPFLEQSAYPLLDLVPISMRTRYLTLSGLLHHLDLFVQFERLEAAGTLEEHLKVDALLNGDALVSLVYALRRWYEIATQPRIARGKREDEEEQEEGESASSPATAQEARARWYARVYPVLLNAINDATPAEREKLREVLFYWTGSRELTLSRLAHALIVHAYAMDGIVLDLPTSRHFGIVLVDGSRKDREEIFAFLQNISAVVPLHLHWLGYARDRRHFSSGSRQREEAGAFGVDDLLLWGARRPSLLMPIFSPIEREGYLPDQCSFVVLLNTEAVLDLADLCGYLPSPEATGPQSALLARDPLVRKNPWREKLYMVPTPEYSGARAFVPSLHVVSSEHLIVLEMQLRKRVVTLLRCSPISELRDDLARYSQESVPRMPEEICVQVERWLEMLADTNAHDVGYDVSLVILWSVMLLSLEYLESAVQLVEKMLAESADEAEARPAFVRRVRRRMGMACTCLLFRFYGDEPAATTSEQHGILLRLLPAFTAQADSYVEFTPLVLVLFRWTEVAGWFARFNDPDGEFFECLGKLSTKNVQPFLEWLERYRRGVGLRRLFINMKKPFHEFRQFETLTRESAKRRKPSVGAEPVPSLPEFEQELLTLQPRENDTEGRNMYRVALAQLEVEQQQLLDPLRSHVLLQGIQHEEALITHITSELQIRLDGKVEILQEREYYGLVVVDAASKEARSQALLFLSRFAEQRKQGKHQQITLTLHQLGNKEIITTVRNRAKIRKEWELATKRKLVPVIGPILERYPAEQVGFLLIVTGHPVIDYYDWAENEPWTTRLWVAGVSKWRPYRGELIKLGDSTPFALEKIVQRVTQGGLATW